MPNTPPPPDPAAATATRLARAASLWTWTGQARPSFAAKPQPNQESVWDYPRPPRLAPDAREVIVRVGGVEILRTVRALRLLETASPPSWYLPLADAVGAAFVPAVGSSPGEWKGSGGEREADGPESGRLGWRGGRRRVAHVEERRKSKAGGARMRAHARAPACRSHLLSAPWCRACAS